MFVGTMALLLIPKILGAITLRRADRRGCGGVPGLVASLVLETILAGLMAPVVMLTQSLHVVSILVGRDSGWNAQRRDDGSVPFRVTIGQYLWHTVLGLALGGIAWAVSSSLALWMTPVVVGLALAILLAAFTARRGIGAAFRRLGLLRIPEEMHPPEVLARANHLAMDEGAAQQHTRGVLRLLDDPVLHAAHRRMLPAAPGMRPDAIDVALATARARLDLAQSPAEALAAMTPGEQLACLADSVCLDKLMVLGERSAVPLHRARA
jgi:membrane glycosyltransferase